MGPDPMHNCEAAYGRFATLDAQKRTERWPLSADVRARAFV